MNSFTGEHETSGSCSLGGQIQNNFFHHLFKLILCTLQVLEGSPHLHGLSTMIFDKESYCVEYEKLVKLPKELLFFNQGQSSRQILV